MAQQQLRPRHVSGEQSIRLKQQHLERALLKLEAIVHPELYASTALHKPSELAALGEEIRQGIRDMGALIPGERDPEKRELARKRLELFTQRLGDLETKTKDHKWTAQAKQREELFQGYDFEAAAGMSEAAEESKSLKHSNTAMDHVLQVGQAVLVNLSEQREGLKRATNRMEDMAGSLGLSSSILRAVRRRQFGDAMIVYGGMFLVCLLLYLFYRWVHL